MGFGKKVKSYSIFYKPVQGHCDPLIIPVFWLPILNCFFLGKGSIKKKLIEFSIKDLPHPPLVEKNNKKTSCFLGFLAHLEQKKFEVFHLYPPQPPPPHWSCGWSWWVVSVLDG